MKGLKGLIQNSTPAFTLKLTHTVGSINVAMSRIAIAATIDPESITGVTSSGGIYSQNVMIEQDAAGKTYVTQRPSINILSDASEEGASTKGRGIYYWAKESALITVNDDEVWSGSYTLLLGNISAGAGQVWIGELGDYLIILDHSNNEGWVLDGSLTLSAISDPDFPTTLAGGGAVLNKTLYVLDREGTIYGSAINDPTSWDALNFIEAEREPDGGSYIVNYLDHIAVFGSRTIEFFYDAANPTGSPLNRREDVSYREGVLTRQSVWKEGDDIYFISADRSGSVKMNRLRAFQIEPLTSVQLQKYLEVNFRLGDIELVVYGAHVFGHVFVFVSLVNFSDSAYVPKETLVFDALTNQWSSFQTTIRDNVYFPVIGWTDRQADSIEFSFGILTTGDVVRFSGGTSAVDSVATTSYVVAGYIESQNDYIAQGEGSDLTSYEMIVRLAEFSGDDQAPVSNHNKFMHKLELSGSFSNTSEVTAVTLSTNTDVVNIRWSDDHYMTYNTPRPLLFTGKQRLSRLGRFTDRAFELSTDTTHRIRLYHLDLYYGVSSYA
jgi:hypothetical protein